MRSGLAGGFRPYPGGADAAQLSLSRAESWLHTRHCVDVKSVTVSQDDGRKTVSEQSVQRITSKETAQT